MPREAIKQYGKTINTSCQFTYSVFFFNLFLYFISLQILSVCLTYILYIFIYQYNASLRDPQRLKKPLKNGVLVSFPFQLRVLGWRSGDSQLPRWTPGLASMHTFCSLLTGSLSLLGKPRQRGQQGFGVVCRPCGIQAEAPELCQVSLDSPANQTPNTGRGEDKDSRCLPWALLSRVLGSRFPRMSPIQDPAGHRRVGQIRKAQPQAPKRTSCR